MLREVVEPGPQRGRRPSGSATRIRVDVTERRNPCTRTTVDQLLALYRGYVRNHISPYLGKIRHECDDRCRPPLPPPRRHDAPPHPLHPVGAYKKAARGGDDVRGPAASAGPLRHLSDDSDGWGLS